MYLDEVIRYISDFWHYIWLLNIDLTWSYLASGKHSVPGVKLGLLLPVVYVAVIDP